ncbi:class II D-tagatose-bisphosphate aldolase, non-catalytic subunit [Serratia ureilytica]
MSCAGDPSPWGCHGRRACGALWCAVAERAWMQSGGEAPVA